MIPLHIQLYINVLVMRAKSFYDYTCTKCTWNELSSSITRRCEQNVIR